MRPLRSPCVRASSRHLTQVCGCDPWVPDASGESDSARDPETRHPRRRQSVRRGLRWSRSHGWRALHEGSSKRDTAAFPRTKRKVCNCVSLTLTLSLSLSLSLSLFLSHSFLLSLFSLPMSFFCSPLLRFLFFCATCVVWEVIAVVSLPPPLVEQKTCACGMNVLAHAMFFAMTEENVNGNRTGLGMYSEVVAMMDL